MTVTRVAALDLQHSRRRSAVVFGPVADVPSRAQAVQRLHAMVDAGPTLRLCLEPSSTSRRWRRSAADIAGSVIDIPVTDPRRAPDPVALLDELRRLPETGVRVALAGEYVAVDFSHGLGDTAFCQAVVDVLVPGVSPADASWQRYRHRVSPLAAASAAVFGSDPRRLRRLAELHRRRPPSPAETSDSAAAQSLRRVPRTAPTARTVRLTADDVATLRDLRDRHLPGVGMFAIYTTALVRSLEKGGIALNPAVTLPFDVRPYLPFGIDTLATFSAGLAFPVGVETSPTELQSLLSESAETGRPVANLLVSTAKIRAASRARLAADPWQIRDGDDRADLLHSFVGRLPQTNAMRWTDPESASSFTVSDPISPRGITVTSAVVGTGALCVAAALHAEHIDAEQVAGAVDGLFDEAVRVVTG